MYLFQDASEDLCQSRAQLARRLYTSFVDPSGLSALLACCLIALDKCPGVWDLRDCQANYFKSCSHVTRANLQDAAGSLQLRAGQIAGIEAAVHAMRKAFSREETEAVLLVDASDAFNSLNMDAALHNIRLINVYHESTQLFVDDIELASEDGTTQGDPLPMPMYALATIPLISRVDESLNIVQVWYADDASAAGSLSSIRSWWDNIVSHGPAFSYYANGSKTWLVTKEPHLDKEREVFLDTQVKITSNGRPVLGAPLGSNEFIVSEKISHWREELSLLGEIAKVNPTLPMLL